MAWVKTSTKVGGGGGGDIDKLIDRSITSISSNVTSIGDYAFYDCAQLTTTDFPEATSIGKFAFRNCSQLTTVNFPKATNIGGSTFSACSQLTTVDFPKATSIGAAVFSACSVLTTLILRSSSVATLESASAFNNTPFASDGTGGTFYVPEDLIASYQAAKNWRTVLGYPNNQIKKIEGSPYEVTT